MDICIYVNMGLFVITNLLYELVYKKKKKKQTLIFEPLRILRIDRIHPSFSKTVNVTISEMMAQPLTSLNHAQACRIVICY